VAAGRKGCSPSNGRAEAKACAGIGRPAPSTRRELIITLAGTIVAAERLTSPLISTPLLIAAASFTWPVLTWRR
jgi:hypothetical protein